jgi:hypothetical protein
LVYNWICGHVISLLIPLHLITTANSFIVPHHMGNIMRLVVSCDFIRISPDDDSEAICIVQYVLQPKCRIYSMISTKEHICSSWLGFWKLLSFSDLEDVCKWKMHTLKFSL